MVAQYLWKPVFITFVLFKIGIIPISAWIGIDCFYAKFYFYSSALFGIVRYEWWFFGG